MKFGSSEAAEQLKACKEGDAELCKTHVRFHPDARGVEETRLGFQGRGDDDDDDDDDQWWSMMMMMMMMMMPMLMMML